MGVVVGHQSGIGVWVERSELHNEEQFGHTIQQTIKHGEKERVDLLHLSTLDWLHSP